MLTRIEISAGEKPLCYADYVSYGEALSVYRELLSDRHFHASSGKFLFRLLKESQGIRQVVATHYIDDVTPELLNILSNQY
ncbi:hypothetical protein ACDQ55_20700 [Chitinophaga sp. 30R24]|uniref:hypothetical protein n=1 Tax=Chitinophaga sp. 30R24 TaxID=3248838 RepID=UPI003B9115E5